MVYFSLFCLMAAIFFNTKNLKNLRLRIEALEANQKGRE